MVRYTTRRSKACRHSPTSGTDRTKWRRKATKQPLTNETNTRRSILRSRNCWVNPSGAHTHVICRLVINQKLHNLRRIICLYLVCLSSYSKSFQLPFFSAFLRCNTIHINWLFIIPKLCLQPTVSITSDEWCVEADVEGGAGHPETHEPYCFSDGCGRISPSLARRVALALQLDIVPSCYQVPFNISLYFFFSFYLLRFASKVSREF